MIKNDKKKNNSSLFFCIFLFTIRIWSNCLPVFWMAELTTQRDRRSRNRGSNFTHATISSELHELQRDTPFISNDSTSMHHWTALHRGADDSRYSLWLGDSRPKLYFYFHVRWINYQFCPLVARAPVTDTHRLFIQVSHWIVRRLTPQYRDETLHIRLVGILLSDTKPDTRMEHDVLQVSLSLRQKRWNSILDFRGDSIS